MNVPTYSLILFLLFLGIFDPSAVLGQQEQDSLQEAQSKIKEMNLIIKDLKMENETFQDILAILRADKERLEREMSDILFGNTQSSAKKSINLRLNKVREPYEEEIRILNNIVASYKTDAREAEDEIAQLLKMNQKLKRQVLFPEEERNVLEQKMDELTTDYKNLQEDYEEKIQDLNNTVEYRINKASDPLKANIDVLKDQLEVSKKEHQIDQAKSEKDSARQYEKIETYKAQIQAYEKAKTRQELLVKRLNDKIDVYKDQIKEKERLLGKQGGLVSDLREKNVVLKKESSILRREKISLDGENKALIKNRDKEIYSLETKNKAQEKRARKVKKQSDNSGAYLNLLQEEVENALELLSY